MSKAIDEKDKNKFLGFSENLLFTMQQHNMKEEQMMYSLADESLNSDFLLHCSVNIISFKFCLFYETFFKSGPDAFYKHLFRPGYF